MRIDGRKSGQLRPVKITPNFLQNPHGSVLIEFGKTRVVCAASVIDDIPPWMKYRRQTGGWITGEYQMIPASTSERGKREIGHPSGRTQEIQRLIGRSLRASADLEKLGSRTIYIDCDVLDADGGTRCAAITGGMVALNLAIARLMREGMLKENPVKWNVAAVSVGIVNGEVLLDLCYEEDSNADVDMNIVMENNGRFIEIQAAAEKAVFSRKEFNEMCRLAEKGIRKLFDIQKKVTPDIALGC